MLKHHFFAALLVCTSMMPTFADDLFPAPRPLAAANAVQYDVKAKSNGLAYRIFVATPLAPPPPGGYRVLYVLDGNAHFPIAAGAARMQRPLQDVLVVGIGYPTDQPFDSDRRYYDLTSDVPDERVPKKFDRPPRTGGREFFADFLQQQVMPAIAARYPVDTSSQALFGHSLGGLFTLHLRFTRPALFASYIAASPSVWWDERAIVTEAKSYAAGKTKDAARVLVTVGGRENQFNMASEAAALAQRLAAVPGAGERVVFQQFDGEDHGSVVPTSLGRALRFAFYPTSPATDTTAGR
ncbi:alpha/beta hydrolase [Jeongeupia naejangsanensis]|uniref:Alpha/beta hydrolase n=1 Tax=Jeongeupia naejangsanensis TaxID=613195 RepID=A0ABS2BJ61_9NEIS|nr:alpha/beta hydrolase-fold protein [Jeongeupia naejangsanensis]MBM3115026.1 alpha/beta hydrolase [Jeongeupia naejangsanensis]